MEVVNLGAQVRKYRRKAGLSQEKLGELIGMSKQNISDIEMGKTGLKGEDLVHILQVLDVSPNQFFEYKGKDIGSILRDGNVRENRLISRLANVVHEECGYM